MSVARKHRMAFHLSLLLAASPPVMAQVAPRYGPVLTSYTTIELADGIYAFISPDSKTSLVSGNTMLVVGSEAALVVDAGHVPAVTRRVIGEIQGLTHAPVRYLVNTHWHNDHVFGNAEYRDAFPGLVIVGHSATRDSILGRVAANLERTRRELPGGIERSRQILTTGRNADGTPLTPDDREFFMAQVADYEGALTAYAGARLAPPTLTFREGVTIDLGGREVKVMWLGLGNTAGDVVVYIPDARVVATGDLVVAPTPYALGSHLKEWPTTMRKLMALDAAHIVPGHGPVMADWNYAEVVTTLIETLYGQVERAAARGLSLDEARKEVDVAAFRQRLTGGDPFLLRSFDQFFLTPAVTRAYGAAQAPPAR